MSKRLNIEYIRNYFANNACILISENYINNRIPLDYICKCGNKSKISFSNFQKGGRCYICGSSKKISAHHKNGYNWDIENRYNIQNGVILCKEHHDSFHLKYGKGNNTEQQFLEFYENNQMYLLR